MLRLAVLLGFVFATVSAFADTLQGKVISVADGDTITVLDSGNHTHRIRLGGIDAPEKRQAYGQVSKDHLAQAVFNKSVCLLHGQRYRALHSFANRLQGSGLMTDSVQELIKAIVAFRDERNWAQFHTIRNLIISINLEAGELLEVTQWKSDLEIQRLPEDAKGRHFLEEELADVLIYLLLLGHEAKIDVSQAVAKKLASNAKRYPVKKYFGSRDKARK